MRAYRVTSSQCCVRYRIHAIYATLYTRYVIGCRGEESKKEKKREDRRIREEMEKKEQEREEKKKFGFGD